MVKIALHGSVLTTLQTGHSLTLNLLNSIKSDLAINVVATIIDYDNSKFYCHDQSVIKSRAVRKKTPLSEIYARNYPGNGAGGVVRKA